MELQLEQLTQQVKDVLEYAQDQSNLNQGALEQLMGSWYQAKRRFIRAFNGMIYEYPEKVSFELGQQEKETKVEEFAHYVAFQCNNHRLSEFIMRNIGSFYSNSMTNPYETYDLRTGETIIIQAGTKIVKAFKYFEYDKDTLEMLQNKASAIIQEDKISGTLCLSVHPLDYLSSSENTHNWRSCHALDGEYMAGNLSYMVDECTLVCYLKSDKDDFLPRFPANIPWNNKKWRVLLFVPRNYSMLFLGRQYPFFADKAAEFLTQRLLPQCGLFEPGTTWTSWTSETISNVNLNNQTYFLWEKYIPVGGTLKTYQDLIIPGEGALNFNDLLNSSCYTPMYCYTLEPERYTDSWSGMRSKYGIPTTKFTVGGPVCCLKCGKQLIRNSATLFCDHCEEDYGHLNNDDFGYCTICGRHISTDHGTWVDDRFVCMDCAADSEECDRCGGVYWREDMYYDPEHDRFLCKYCCDY